jgi:hypothetical protein
MNGGSVTYRWDYRRDSFLSKKPSRTLVCITDGHVPELKYCCRCGSSRPKPFPLKVKPVSDFNFASKLAGVPLGTIGVAVEYLARKKVNVPCCSACLLLRHLGYALGVFFSLLGLFPFITLATLDQATELRVNQPSELIAVLALFILPTIGIGISAWCSWRSLPVAVYSLGNKLYFEFWSPGYQQQVLSLASPESPIPLPHNYPDSNP